MTQLRIDTALVGQPIEVADAVWDERDVMLYALGVGAGQADPYAELEFTTENIEGRVLQVLPTFGTIISHRLLEAAINVADAAAVVHAEQALELAGPLPAAGSARVSGTVTSIYDKGGGALLAVEGAAHDRDTGSQLLAVRASVFIRGAGGFGGDRGPAAGPSPIPNVDPDLELPCEVPGNQALLYRLSGDRNPLHVDPTLASRAGFARPILHGLCTYGYAGRLLLHHLCDSDPARLRSIAARFSSPVLPGQTLTIQVWESASSVAFRVVEPGGKVVLDRGVLMRH